MEWISVKDRLPKDGQIVIGYGKNPQMSTGKYCEFIVANELRGAWTHSTPSMPFSFTHWMPSPITPKEE